MVGRKEPVIAKLQEVLSKVPSPKQAINRGLATVYLHVYDQQILEDQYPVLQDPRLVRAGQMACLRLLTALPLSNNAEFVTKNVCGNKKGNLTTCAREYRDYRRIQSFSSSLF